jgi:hypothetical protein
MARPGLIRAVIVASFEVVTGAVLQIIAVRHSGFPPIRTP